MSALWTSDEVARALLPIAMAAPFKATGVTFDSRAVLDGDLFFALPGETTDGHAFVAGAADRVVAAILLAQLAGGEVEQPAGQLRFEQLAQVLAGEFGQLRIRRLSKRTPWRRGVICRALAERVRSSACQKAAIARSCPRWERGC